MADESITFEMGELTVEELAAAFDAVPANVCFIDVARTIRYVSRYGIFGGYDPSIIGTDVLDCHSETTRPRILEMLEAFEAGTRDSDGHIAQKQGRSVKVAYRPVRTRQGRYLGCLEVAHWMDGKD